MATTPSGETEERRAARARRVRVPGLLLISAAGETYFIEGGIRANKANNLMLQQPAMIPERPALGAFPTELADRRKLGALLLEPDGNLRHRLGFEPRSYGGEPAAGGRHNVGPMLFQGYSVFLERDEASEGEITGNAHDLRTA
jgi:hypothetical protein